MECTLSKFADDTQLGGVVNMPEGWDVIWRNLDKPEKWACVSLVRFNKAKCKVLHLGRGNPYYWYRLGDEEVESSPAGKDLGVLVDEKLDVSWHGSVCSRASRALGCIPSSVGTGRGRAFCPSALLW